jgi:hypothetical protein
MVDQSACVSLFILEHCFFSAICFPFASFVHGKNILCDICNSEYIINVQVYNIMN